MAAPSTTVRSDRALEQVVLQGNELNVDGDKVVGWTLPTGFGDCVLLNVFVGVNSIATMMADSTTKGPTVYLWDATGYADVVGTEPWTLRAADGVSAFIDPDQAVFWREGELLYTAFPEADANAAPTGDLQVVFKVRRLRQLGAVPRQPRGLQLTS